MSILKRLKFGDISRIAAEIGVSAGYVQTALRGECGSVRCQAIRDYAEYIAGQYDAREVELVRILNAQRDARA